MRVQARSQRGFGLFDAVIALAVLAFGMLGLTRFQTHLASQGIESQQRSTAGLLADELLDTMLVDAGNAPCYTWPQTGACGSAAALALTTDWHTRAMATLPGATSAVVALDAVNNRLTVSLTWTGKDSTETRLHEVTSDVRRN